MAKLVIHHGELVTEHQLGEDSVVIGRDPECDLYFTDRKLSRHHARIVRVDDGGFDLVDLGSRNGSWVNEERVDEHRLDNNDEIRLGSLRIMFDDGSSKSTGSTASASLPDTGSYASGADATVHLEGAPAAARDSTGTLSAEEIPSVPAVPIERIQDGKTVRLESSSGSTRTIAPNVPSETKAPSHAGASAAGDETAMLSSQTELPAPEGPQGRDADGSATMEKPPTGTVAFAPGAIEPKSSDAGTVMFRAGQTDQADAPGEPSVERPAQTVQLDSPQQAPPGESSITRLAGAPVPGVAGPRQEPMELGDDFRPAQSGLSRIALSLLGVAILAVVVLALPLARMTGAAVQEQSRLRGLALAELLAEENVRIAADGRRGELRVDRATREPGVVAAVLVDRTGRILAPSAQAGEAATSLPALSLESDELDVGTIRTPRVLSTSQYLVFAAPMTSEGRVIGLALVSLDVGKASASVRPWLVVGLGSLLLLVGVAAAALAASRLLLVPMEQLRDDVDAAAEGRIAALDTKRQYRELEELAFGFARWFVSDEASERSSAMDQTVLADDPRGPEQTVVPSNPNQS